MSDPGAGPASRRPAYRAPSRLRQSFAARPRWWWPAHLGVFGLVVEVAFVHLSNADAAPDEFTYRTCGEAYVHGQFACNLEHPLLAKEILGIGSWIFGDSIAAARTTTGIIAVITAFCCYRVCRDVAGVGAGLAAAALWGLLPQVGVENHTVLEAVRVDRFALLDPFVACAFALALVAGVRLARRGGARWAVVLGAAVAAAACAKAPGALLAPVLVAGPLLVRHRRGASIGRVGLWIAAGALVVAIASYAPLGPRGAVHAISFMFDFQGGHALREVVVGGHFHVAAPWWSDLYFATSATGAVIAIVLAVCACIGLWRFRLPAAYALGAAASVVIGVGFGIHLSAPHYFIDWEPGAVVAAALGLAALARIRLPIGKVAALAAGVVLALGAVETVGAANTLALGPYASAAPAMACDRPCVVAYVGFIDVLSNYLPRDEYLSAVPPNTRAGRVVARVISGGHRTFEQVDVIVLDPAAYVLHGSWRRSITYFVDHARVLGYVRVPTPSRVEVFRRVAFDRPS